MASTIVDGSKEAGRIADLVCGVKSAMASSSWNAPLVVRSVSDEPARMRVGNALAEEFPICFEGQQVRGEVDD